MYPNDTDDPSNRPSATAETVFEFLFNGTFVVFVGMGIFACLSAFYDLYGYKGKDQNEDGRITISDYEVAVSNLILAPYHAGLKPRDFEFWEIEEKPRGFFAHIFGISIWMVIALFLPGVATLVVFYPVGAIILGIDRVAQRIARKWGFPADNEF